MKSAFTVLFVIAMVISSTQTFRHVYVKWIAPQGSVLDEFKTELDTEIAASRSLDELVELYRDAKQRAEDAGLTDLEDREELRRIMASELEDPKRQILADVRSIRQEIQTREGDQRRLFTLKFYWSAGLASVVIGALVLKFFNAWIGFSGIVIGFSEMLCWTSPLFYRFSTQQFASLLDYKLAFSLITWAVLIALWLLIDRGALKVKGG